jgi:hypothetical protein
MTSAPTPRHELGDSPRQQAILIPLCLAMCWILAALIAISLIYVQFVCFPFVEEFLRRAK